MKHIWRGLGALVLAASLAACGSSGPSDTSGSTPETQAPVTAEAADPNLPDLAFEPVTNWLVTNGNRGFTPFAQVRLVIVNQACLLETKSRTTGGYDKSDFTPMPPSACAVG